MSDAQAIQSISVQLKDGVAIVHIDRPDKLNALDSQTIEVLLKTLKDIAEDEKQWVVILTGRGAAFSVGGDLREAMAIGDQSDWEPRMRKWMSGAAALIMQMRRMSNPIIAAINGPAIGGGMALATAADIRICSTSAYFSTAFVSIGLVGFEMGLSLLLPAAIGPGPALNLAILGGRLSAQEALRLNFVTEVVPADDLLARAQQLAENIARQSARAVRSTKEMMRNHVPLEQLQRTLEAELEAQMKCVFSPDNRAAMAKIVERSA